MLTEERLTELFNKQLFSRDDGITPSEAKELYDHYQEEKEKIIHEVLAGIDLRYQSTLQKYWKIYAESL